LPQGIAQYIRPTAMVSPSGSKDDAGRLTTLQRVLARG
jgi:hypothetical protein